MLYAFYLLCFRPAPPRCTLCPPLPPFQSAPQSEWLLRTAMLLGAPPPPPPGRNIRRNAGFWWAPGLVFIPPVITRGCGGDGYRELLHCTVAAPQHSKTNIEHYWFEPRQARTPLPKPCNITRTRQSCSHFLSAYFFRYIYLLSTRSDVPGGAT